MSETVQRPPEAVPSDSIGETTVEIDGVGYTVKRARGNIPVNSYSIYGGDGRYLSVSLTTNDPLAVTWAVRGWLEGYERGLSAGRHQKGKEVAKTVYDLLNPDSGQLRETY